MFFDNFAIPKDAAHVAEAHAFIDYMMRPDVAAKNSNLVAYANGNLASQKFIEKAVIDDRSIYPDAATMSRLYVVGARDQRAQRAINRLWTKIKTGR
jgi:putrescine transport system substrate-binding protein